MPMVTVEIIQVDRFKVDVHVDDPDDAENVALEKFLDSSNPDRFLAAIMERKVQALT